MKFPRIRFTLRTLLAAVALCAVACWVYVDAWPRWQDYRTRRYLRDPNATPTQRLRALEAWVKLKRRAVPELTKALGDKDPSVRRLAAIALGRVGSDAEDAVPALILALDDPDERTRQDAICALPRVCQSIDEVAPIIARLLTAPETSVRDEAAQTLVQIGQPAIPAVVEMLTNPDGVDPKQIIEILGRIGKEDPAVASALKTVLKNGDDALRELALRQLGRVADLEIPDVLDLLRDRNAAIRQMGLSMLGDLIPDAVTPYCLQSLQDEDSSVRYTAISVLARYEGGSAVPRYEGGVESAVPSLLQALQGEPYYVRVDAARAIAKIGPDAKDAVPALVLSMMGDKPTDDELPYYAGRALSRISPEDARAQVATLVERLNDADPNVRAVAVHALRGIGPEATEAVPALIESLDSDRGDAAARALGEIGPDAGAATGKLIGLLLRARQRDGAIYALGRIGPKAKDAIPILLGLLEPSINGATANDFARSREQCEAAVAVARIDASGSRSAPVLAEILEDESRDAMLRASAAEGLGEGVHQTEDAVRAILRALSDPSPMVRTHAAVALGRPGSESKRIVSALVNALNDPNPYVRTGAAQALGRIGPEAISAVPALVEASITARNSPTNVRTHAPANEIGSMVTHLIGEMHYKSVRGAALQALESIDPEAARRAAENPTIAR